MKYAIGGLVILVLLLAAGVLARNLYSSGETQLTNPLPRATAFPIEQPFWGEVKNFEAVGKRVLAVKVRLMNTGDEEDEGECDLVAYDKTGAISSLPITTGGPATPGYGVTVEKRLRINAPAASVERIEVAC